MIKRSVIAILALAGAALSAGVAWAHHGWSWTTGESIELVGVIEAARLGNPHGVLDVDVDGVTWNVEVGQPWRNERAGLKDDDLAEGVKVRLVGEPSKNPEEKRLKVVKLYIGDVEYVLYAERV
ncbi:MAG: DUF6152 family protein [Amphiplicatus sp.]